MKILVFDTETTGIPNFRLQSDHPSQPHIVQLAMSERNYPGDVNNYTRSYIIKPDGYSISEDTSAIHGITQKYAEDYGNDIRTIVNEFWGISSICDAWCAFNGGFDIKMIRIESLRIGMSREKIAELELPMFDPCRLLTPIMNLPPTRKMVSAGFNKPKPPNLAEAYRYCFGEDFSGAHNAEHDVAATARILRYLIDRDLFKIIEP